IHYNNLCKYYNYDDCEFCAIVVWGIGEKTVFKRKYFDIFYAEFEKSKFKVPKYYDEVLKKQYGNYMKLPPENERIAHSYLAYWK
ncbi:MAG: LicD family protein, partial [Lachnospiraceae bacterium]|nr:LicD family protein [Lachnospiraceae bacterium]